MMHVYSVLDKAVGAYMTPFFVRASGEAIRTFADAVNDRQSPFFKHYNDFVLYHVGSFDPASGVFKSMEPVKVITAQDVLQDNVDVMPPVGARALAG